MKNIISGFIYFLVGSSVLLIILIIIVTFSSQMFDFQAPGREATGDIDPDLINSPRGILPDNAITVSVSPGVRLSEAVLYDGEFELPVNGATGYAAVSLDVSDGDFSVTLAVLDPGEAFVILKEDGQFWQINAGGTGNIIGWVRHDHCMINLPDVIPSMIYNNTNAYSSLLMANLEDIPNISGERLYSYSGRRDGKAWNERLQRYEYIVPVLYATAKRIYQAQLNALANGDTIIMYEAFRPYSVQELIYNEVSALPSSQKNFGSWSQSMFIAGGTSNHQTGYAVDVSLGNVISADYMVSGRYKYPQLRYIEYQMPSMLHELSIASAVYTSPGSRTFSEGMQNSESAMNLHRYCTGAGFSPLASEWWHFSDGHTAAALTRQSDGRYYITEVLSVPPG